MGVRRKIATALAAGVTATTLLAWSCVMWSTTKGTGISADGASIPEVVQELIPAEWLDAQPPKVAYGVGTTFRGIPRPGLMVACAEDVGFGASSVCVTIDHLTDRASINSMPEHELIHVMAGWPFDALRGFVIVDAAAHPNSKPFSRTLNALVKVPDWAQPGAPFSRVCQRLGYVHLPLRIMPLGFIGNTLIFSTAVLAVTLGIPGLCRWLRVRRGGCGVCGYSRAGLAIGAACPECGKGPA